MTDQPNDRQTDSVLTDLPFEYEVTESIAFYKAIAVTDRGFTGSQRTDFLRVCVQTALKSDGSAAPKHVARAARAITEPERDSHIPDEIGESVRWELQKIYERNNNIQKHEEPPLEGFPVFHPVKRPTHSPRTEERDTEPRDRSSTKQDQRD